MNGSMIIHKVQTLFLKDSNTDHLNIDSGGFFIYNAPMSDSFIVKGNGGKKTLEGTVTIGGAKNAVLKMMAASVLFNGPLTLQNVPMNEDVKRMHELLIALGATVTNQKDFVIDPTPIHSTVLDTVKATAMRSSVVLTGPLLARYKTATFPAPGGCTIGNRPIDLFIKAYEKMGATVEYKDESYLMHAPNGLTGTEIFFDLQTVTGTETIMLAATLAKGKTILKNCAMEPEIKHMADYLVSCGAQISGQGTSTIIIEGGELLKAQTPYITLPDRIETGSFIILGALLAKKIRIEKCDPSLVESLLSLLKESGVRMDIGKDYIEILESNNLKSFNVRTHEYPGFPTDLQSPIVTYLTQTKGESTIFETIFEGRFKFVENLKKMGAHVNILNNREVVVKGPTPLKASTLESYDLRGGFSAVVSGLLAQGESVIHNVYYIDRGYESLETRLNAIGANIQRIQ